MYKFKNEMLIKLQTLYCIEFLTIVRKGGIHRVWFWGFKFPPKLFALIKNNLSTIINNYITITLIIHSQ